MISVGIQLALSQLNVALIIWEALSGLKLWLVHQENRLRVIKLRGHSNTLNTFLDVDATNNLSVYKCDISWQQ